MTLGLAPILVSLTAIVVLVLRDSPEVHEAPLVLAALNMVFLSAVPLVVAYLAAVSYRSTGAAGFLFLGCGLLLLGTSSFFAGWVMPLADGPNPTVTVHNLGVLAAAVFQLAAAWSFTAEMADGTSRASSHRDPRVIYGALFLLACLVTALAFLQQLPSFFSQDEGPTPLRQLVLGGAILLSSASGALFLHIWNLTKAAFAYWYSLATFLLTVGLVGVLLQHEVGSAVGWAGRGAQYLAGLYFLLALLAEKPMARTEPGSTASPKRVLWPALERLASERTKSLAQANEALKTEIASRKAAELAQRQSRSLLESIINSTSDAVYAKDLEGRYVLFSSGAEALTGRSAADVLGHDDYAVFPAAEARALMDTDARVLESATSMTYEETLTGAGGRPHRFLTTKGPMRDESGSLLGLFGIARDITERKQIEEARALSEERYRRLFELGSDAIVLVDSETGQVLDANDAAASLYGYSREEWLTMNHTDVSVEFEETRRAAMEGSTRIPVRWHRKKDGTVFPVEIAASHFEYQGRTTHMAAIRDITERRQAEDALRESERMLRVAEATAHLGYYDIDVATGTSVWSEETFHIFGLSPGGSAPSVEAYRDLVHPEDRDLVFGQFSYCLEEAAPFDLSYRIVRGDGSIRHVHSIGRVETDAGGKVDRMVGTLQDVTEHTLAEEKLRKAEEQLRQSQKMETVGRLAGGVAHDFNNLLTAIIGQAEILREDTTSEMHRSGLEEIVRVAGRAARLTQQLLAFSRRQPQQTRVFIVSDVIRSLEGLLARTLGEDVELILREEAPVWPVEADPSQLEQVIMNLVVNARDAMPEGGRLILETANHVVSDEGAELPAGLKPGPYVRLLAADTGRGMDADTVEHIFEPFFTTKEPGKGTGLGLSTAYGIIKQSGGFIEVQSAPGEGTAFRVYLPRSEKPADWSPDDQPPQDLELRGGRETVLVVEDEAAVLRLAVRILESQGYRVTPAASPDEALALLREADSEVELVLTDVVLPGMSGRDLVELILARPGVRPPRVLYMSGYPRNVIVHQGRVDEGIRLLEKPFSPVGLLQKVREVLDAAEE